VARRVVDDDMRRYYDQRAHEYKRFSTPEELATEIGGGAVLHSGRWFVAVAG
jgi:hypothetical protein